MSFNREAGHAGSANSPAMMDFNSSTDSYGESIHIIALITAARTYTHSQATVMRTASIRDDSMLDTDSFPPVEMEEGSGETFDREPVESQ